MIVVDSHCHVSLSWYEPVETLLFQMDRYGVSHAVLVQMQGQTNNDYQFACVRRYPGRFAPVVVVDTERADAPGTLQRLAEQGASGVRLRAMARSPGDDPLAIWHTAGRLGLAVSCFGSSAEFASDGFAALVQSLPEVTIVLEHLGSHSRPDTTDSERALRQHVFALARFPNTAIKITGLGEFCHRVMPVTEPFPFTRPIPPYLQQAYDAFGPRRMMWGSDYPPVDAREGYSNALHGPMEALADRSEEERALIFGGTARAIFPPRDG
ncbi:MAG: amidohydrolase family protein [Chloroflexota bacterium]|nr:amidohydrolase family protein [Chloroflexota bacterium]